MFLSVICIALVATAVNASHDKNRDGGMVGTPGKENVVTTEETLADGTLVKTTQSSSSSSFSSSSRKDTSSSSSSSSDEKKGKKKTHSFTQTSTHSSTQTNQEKHGGFNIGGRVTDSINSMKGRFKKAPSGLREIFSKKTQ